MCSYHHKLDAIFKHAAVSPESSFCPGIHPTSCDELSTHLNALHLCYRPQQFSVLCFSSVLHMFGWSRHHLTRSFSTNIAASKWWVLIGKLLFQLFHLHQTYFIIAILFCQALHELQNLDDSLNVKWNRCWLRVWQFFQICLVSLARFGATAQTTKQAGP